jgi:hypothetical protein
MQEQLCGTIKPHKEVFNQKKQQFIKKVNDQVLNNTFLWFFVLCSLKMGHRLIIKHIYASLSYTQL